MTSVHGPDFVALQVRDLEAAAEYYEAVFGFVRARISPPDAVVFNTKPIPLALRRPVRPLPPQGPLGVGVVLWVACDDADRLHSTMWDNGATLLSAPADGPFGRFFTAQDPDGYVLTFHQVPDQAVQQGGA